MKACAAKGRPPDAYRHPQGSVAREPHRGLKGTTNGPRQRERKGNTRAVTQTCLQPKKGPK